MLFGGFGGRPCLQQNQNQNIGHFGARCPVRPQSSLAPSIPVFGEIYVAIGAPSPVAVAQLGCRPAGKGRQPTPPTTATEYG